MNMIRPSRWEEHLKRPTLSRTTMMMQTLTMMTRDNWRFWEKDRCCVRKRRRELVLDEKDVKNKFDINLKRNVFYHMLWYTSLCFFTTLQFCTKITHENINFLEKILYKNEIFIIQYVIVDRWEISRPNSAGNDKIILVVVNNTRCQICRDWHFPAVTGTSR